MPINDRLGHQYGDLGARLFWEYFGTGYFNVKGVTSLVAVSVFPNELYPASRSWPR